MILRWILCVSCFEKILSDGARYYVSGGKQPVVPLHERCVSKFEKQHNVKVTFIEPLIISE